MLPQKYFWDQVDGNLIEQSLFSKSSNKYHNQNRSYLEREKYALYQLSLFEKALILLIPSLLTSDIV